MSDEKTYPIPDYQIERALVDQQRYQEMYEQSLEDPETFWSEQAEELIDWFTPWDKLQSGNFRSANIKWFEGARL